jgi:lipid-A-disaccharide synthase
MTSGEVSGDVAGAGIADALIRRFPGSELFGIGGPKMEAHGVDLVCRTNSLGAVGVSEALSVIPSLGHAFRELRRRIRATTPDAAVLIGNDVFSVLLARWLRSLGIPTAAYHPPQVWIWGALAGTIARSYNLILTSFPQEHAIYAQAGFRARTDVSFVGHYLADQLETATSSQRASIRRSNGLDEFRPVVCVMPGSRQQEIRVLAPVLFEATRELAHRSEDIHFLVPIADPRFTKIIQGEIESQSLGRRVTMVDSGIESLRACDLAVMASGTASLEASILGVPMVTVYGVSKVTSLVVRTAIRVGLMPGDTIALPNLILGRRVVPELRQDRLVATNIAQEAWSILTDPHRANEMRKSLDEVAELVRGPGSFNLAAAKILEIATTGNLRHERSDAATRRLARG